MDASSWVEDEIQAGWARVDPPRWNALLNCGVRADTLLKLADGSISLASRLPKGFVKVIGSYRQARLAARLRVCTS
jgi:hypothetical protein